MKLKNLAFFGVMGAILSVAAAQAAPVATTDYLTTKGYVDARDTATKNAAVTAAINAISEAGTYQAALTETQLNAVNSGITAAKVSGYDSVQSAVNNASTGLATKAAASDLTSHTSDTDIHVTTSDKATWSGKQDAISDLATIRSGAEAGATALQASDVDQTYDATSTDPISGKGVADAGFITSAALGGYATESYADEKAAAAQAAAEATAAADATSKANAAQAAAEATAASLYQTKLNETQLAAANSGITSAKVTTYDGYASGKEDTGVAAGLVNALNLTTVNTSGKAIVSVGQANGQVSAAAGEISNVGIASNAAIAPSKLDLSQSNCPENRTCVLTYDRAGNTYVATPLTLDDDTPTPANNG